MKPQKQLLLTELTDVPVRPLVISVERSILGYMPVITAGHVAVKLPYIGLLPQTQIKELASCTLLAEVLPRLKCSPEGFV